MYRKAIVILIFSLIVLNVSALDIDQFPENQTETTTGDIAIMKGELTISIEKVETNIIKDFDKKLKESEERIKSLIEERTNPFLTNMPTIILIIIFGLVWVILKAREKV